MSALRRWEPFRGLIGLQSDLDRMFDEFFGRGPVPTLQEVRIPSVDISETLEDVLVKAEVPGVSKDNLELEVMPESLSLRAEMKQETEQKDETFHRKERRWQRFERVVPLPAEVVVDKVKATLTDGVLEIRLPKSAKSKATTPRKISVE